ncbi:DnaJ domain containing protein [Sesbania bispinosa]|nr:DnaJ domain containing protein [Sesbania bispinosa]
MNTTNTRAEADKLLEIGEQLLQNRDLKASRDLAILAQETEPLHEGSDQLLGILDVLEASEKCLNNNTPDWYAILQVDRATKDLNLIKNQYRRLAILLQPDKNFFSFAHQALKLVSDAWAVLSDPVQKAIYDQAFDRPGGDSPSTFWTACPYCYRMYEYPRVYEGCCLKCQNCDKSFHGLSIPAMPQMVPGQEAYYCNWGFLPMGFVFQKLEDGGETAPVSAVPNNGVASAPAPPKRGRPRKVV